MAKSKQQGRKDKQNQISPNKNLNKQNNNKTVSEIEKVQNNGKQKKNFKRSLDEIESPPKKFAKIIGNDAVESPNNKNKSLNKQNKKIKNPTKKMAENSEVERKGKETQESPSNNKKNFNKRNKRKTINEIEKIQKNGNQKKNFKQSDEIENPLKKSAKISENKAVASKETPIRFSIQRGLSLSVCYGSESAMASHISELKQSSSKYNIKHIAKHHIEPKLLIANVGEKPVNELQRKELLSITKASNVSPLFRFSRELNKLVSLEYDDEKIASTILKKGSFQFRGRKLKPQPFLGQLGIVYQPKLEPLKVSKDATSKKQSALTSVVQDKEMVEEESDDEEDVDEEEESDDEEDVDEEEESDDEEDDD